MKETHHSCSETQCRSTQDEKMWALCLNFPSWCPSPCFCSSAPCIWVAVSVVMFFMPQSLFLFCHWNLILCLCSSLPDVLQPTFLVFLPDQISNITGESITAIYTSCSFHKTDNTWKSTSITSARQKLRCIPTYTFHSPYNKCSQ